MHNIPSDVSEIRAYGCVSDCKMVQTTQHADTSSVCPRRVSSGCYAHMLVCCEFETPTPLACDLLNQKDSFHYIE